MSERALLVIADIGGYTKFMRVHRINLAHAQYIISQLLEAVIDGAEPYLKLAKLEGDAAFFYAVVPKNKDDEVVARVARIIATIRAEFLAKRLEIETHRVCTCDACMQAGQLKLKFVAHVGEVAFQKIRRLTELAGVDVIFVHRLLKNNVPVPEYALMSEPIHAHLDEPLRTLSVESHEDLEGLGEVKTFYVDLQKVEHDMPKALERSFLRRVLGWLHMTIKMLPYFAGAKTACVGFRNLGAVDPSLALPESAAPKPPSLATD